MEQTFTLLAFNGEIIPNLVILTILLFVSALVSGSEAACFSLSNNDLLKFRESNETSDIKILKLLLKQDYLLATILITNNLVNIGAVITANRIIDLSLSFNSVTIEFTIKTIIVTFLLLLIGEIIPKIIATANPFNYVRRVASFLNFLCKLLKPIAFILIKSSSKISNNISHKKDPISIDDLSHAINLTTPGNNEDKKILKGIIRFVSTEVTDIMCPRIDTVAVEINDSFETLKDIIVRSGFSRLPVYEGEKDVIKGLIYAKDLIAHTNKEEYEWQKLMRKPYYVPEHKKINDLLEEFQTMQVHVAIVVDEYGSMQGIISLEDILEEIVGEISDESDKHHSLYTKLSHNCYLFDAKCHISDFLKIFELSDDYFDKERGQAETLAGLMLEIKRDFLQRGDSFEINGLTLNVESITGKRAEKIKVTKNG